MCHPWQCSTAVIHRCQTRVFSNRNILLVLYLKGVLNICTHIGNPDKKKIIRNIQKCTYTFFIRKEIYLRLFWDEACKIAVTISKLCCSFASLLSLRFNWRTSLADIQLFLYCNSDTIFFTWSTPKTKTIKA